MDTRSRLDVFVRACLRANVSSPELTRLQRLRDRLEEDLEVDIQSAKVVRAYQNSLEESRRQVLSQVDATTHLTVLMYTAAHPTA